MKFKIFEKIILRQGFRDVAQYLQSNLLLGKLPIAIYSCPKCDEILQSDLENHSCTLQQL